MDGLIRIATCVPDVSVGDTEKNKESVIKMMREAGANKADITVFPELCLTGYTCGDLFYQQTLLDGAKNALKDIVEESKNVKGIFAIGLPVEAEGRMYNCAAIVSDGKLWGLVPKTYVPTYNEFYEKRWFSSLTQLGTDSISAKQLGLIQEDEVPIGSILFKCNGFTFGAEICEDAWAAVTPGSILALNGAEVIINLSASNETIAKRSYRRNMVSQHSASQISTYAYVSAGCKESTGDLVFSGHSIVCENGRILTENAKTVDSGYILYADTDLDRIRADRRKNKTFAENGFDFKRNIKKAEIEYTPFANGGEYFSVEKLPFVPSGKKDRSERCKDIFAMQVAGLKKRMEITRSKPVIGVSGGLDSTLALLVAVEAVRSSGGDVKDVYGITMPCFGTTDRTYNNSLLLMKSLGITYLEIPIKKAVECHFEDIGQERDKYDLTFENSQARERTQVLMDYAGKVGGFVVGTGDLSELALGWCTYNADHMSMYGVNCGVPKTLVRWMVATIAGSGIFAESTEVLKDILNTPISPELLPPDEQGKIAQQTEEIVGPYALHDFFLYYTVRFGFAPEKVFALAQKAFKDDFDGKTVKKWLVSFYKRFFTQQFKRSCLPDGVKIGSICLSPRGDWRMPSDASSAEWVKRAESIEI